MRSLRRAISVLSSLRPIPGNRQNRYLPEPHDRAAAVPGQPVVLRHRSGSNAAAAAGLYPAATCRGDAEFRTSRVPATAADVISRGSSRRRVSLHGATQEHRQSGRGHRCRRDRSARAGGIRSEDDSGGRHVSRHRRTGGNRSACRGLADRSRGQVHRADVTAASDCRGNSTA